MPTVAWITVRRAAEILSITKRKTNFLGGWEWSFSQAIPEGAHPHHDNFHSPTVENKGHSEQRSPEHNPSKSVRTAQEPPLGTCPRCGGRDFWRPVASARWWCAFCKLPISP